MPLIKIVEQDLTTPGVFAQENDVVYIPGFVDTTQENLNTDEGYVGIKAFKPTYFSDVKAFESLCGKQGAKFKTTQKYTDLITKNPDGTYNGFASDAIPQHRVMFYEGTIDPSYVMAKELLNAGLPVVYERMNKDETFVGVTEKPKDWEENYTSYYKEVPVYVPIVGTTAPELFTQHAPNDEAPAGDVNYYIIDEDAQKDGYTVYTKTNKSDVINGEGKFIKYCYSQKQNYFKFEHPTDTVTKEFEANKFYTIKPTKASLKSGEDYVAGKFFTFDEDNNTYTRATGTFEESAQYYKVTTTLLNTKPVGWGDDDIEVYEATEVDNNTVQKLVKVDFEDWTSQDVTYYVFDETVGYIELSESDLEEDEQENNIYAPSTLYIKSSLLTEEDGVINVPDTWFSNFNEYCEVGTAKALYEVAEQAPNFPQPDDKGNAQVFKLYDFIDITAAYEALAHVFNASKENSIADMGAVNIKYVTSGGYPIYEYNNGSLVSAIKSVAASRGDCVAFIDHTNNPYRTTNINLESSLYATVKADDSIGANGEFATMFTPWMNYSRVTTDTNTDGEASPSMITMSATFGYLLALADSLKTNASWLAVAGATRGQVPNLAQVATATPISNGTADSMQPRDGISINAITEINPYGQTIWGNRTLKNNATEGNLTATSFLNIRHLVSDVKKVCYATARALTFEQNNDVLWVNFKSKISPTLDRMVSGYGISGYKIVRDTDHEKASEKATLCAKIILYPTYAVEDFYITIVLKDEEVGVSE